MKAKNKAYLQSLEKQIKEVKEIRESHRHDDDNYIKTIYDDIKNYELEEKVCCVVLGAVYDTYV